MSIYQKVVWTLMGLGILLAVINYLLGGNFSFPRHVVEIKMTVLPKKLQAKMTFFPAKRQTKMTLIRVFVFALVLVSAVVLWPFVSDVFRLAGECYYDNNAKACIDYALLVWKFIKSTM